MPTTFDADQLEDSDQTGDWEQFITLDDVWDGPVHGVVDFYGVPHIFEKPFNEEEDEYENRFCYLAPIAPEAMALVLEKWKIYLAWWESVSRGELSDDTHPCLAK